MVWYHTTAMMPVELMRRIKSFNTTVGGIGKQWTQRRKPVAPCFVTRRFFWTNEEIANEGSIARDILATERTFLAWARTGLGFVGAGSALAAAYHRQDRKLAPEIAPFDWQRKLPLVVCHATLLHTIVGSTTEQISD